MSLGRHVQVEGGNAEPDTQYASPRARQASTRKGIMKRSLAAFAGPLCALASQTGLEPAQAHDSKTVELGEEDGGSTGPDFTDEHHV